ncbi:MAG: HupE/UreJ family protein [Pseudomonadota bacterium]
MPGNSATLALLLLSAFWASDVAAHEIMPGVTGFPALMLHPLFNQFQLLAIIVIGLAIASGRPPPLLLALVVVPSAMIAGNLVPLGVFSPMGGFPAIALAALLASGAIVAAFEQLPVAVVGIIAGLLALLIGVDTVPEYPGPWGRAQTILATALTTIAMSGFISYVLGAPRPLWRSVAARMISAWVFAAAAMMLALLLKPHTGGAG